jgi:protein SCO1/2
MLKFVSQLGLLFAISLAVVSCGKNSATQPSKSEPQTATNSTVRTFDVRGVVIEIAPAEKSVRIRHEAIPDYMPAMTMPFDVRDTNELTGLAPGDSIAFKMNVTDTDGWIAQIKKLPATNDPAAILPANAPMRIVRDVEPLAVGDFLPDYRFTNHLGNAVNLGALRGKALAFTFIFTRCPYPTFCPLMTSNFKTTHELLSKNPPSLTNWMLLEITIDPEFDTPERLAGHAGLFKADATRWSFLTGSLMDITALSEQCGLQFVREPGGGISHNLRTVIVDASGRVQRIIAENKWTANELVDEILKGMEAK